MAVLKRPRRTLALVVAFVAGPLALIPPSAEAIDRNWTDTTFAGGPVVVDVGASQAYANAVAMQEDGKAVVAGTAVPVGGYKQIVVLRFLADGRPDPGFGQAGQVFVGADGADYDGLAVSLQSDGKILVAGGMSRRRGEQPQMAVARLEVNGALDTTFAGGVVSIEGRTVLSTAVGVAVLPDGRILLGGYGTPIDWQLPGAVSRSRDFMVAQLRPDGTLDPAFGQNGVTLSTADGNPDSTEVASAMVVGSDGRILIGGSSDWTFALTRYTAAGVLDASFGDGGTVTTDTRASSTAKGVTSEVKGLALQPDGRIVATGSRSTNDGTYALTGAFVLARYLADGRLDADFGPGGMIIAATQPLRGSAVAVTPTGRIIVAGSAIYVNTEGDGALIAYTPTGALDSSFGRAGVATTNLGGSDAFTAVAIQPDGRVMAVGLAWRSGKQEVMAVRFPPLDAISTVFAWGFNGKGQLGIDSLTDAHTPVPVPGLSRINTVAAGAYHSLSVRDDGTVQAWGWNGAGSLGDGTTVDRDTPVDVVGMAGASTVAAGYFHSLAVRGGKVWAWGWNGFGQLGDGTRTDRLTPVPVPGLTGVVAVAGGAFHSLALKADGTVWAWGWNGFGQLGDGTTTDRLVPVQVLGVHDASVIAAGGFHSMASSSVDGSWSWGFNHFGQLGIGPFTLEDRHTPLWQPLGSFVAMAGGAYHSMALSPNGVVQAWGFNGFGQAGDGTTADVLFRKDVAGLSDVTAIAAGIFHSMALDGSGKVSSWGWNYFGQLGDGSTVDKHVPVPAAGLTGASVIAAGAFHSVVPRITP